MRILLLFLVLLSTNLYAQKQENIIYDVIYMKDGRVLRGEILLFQEKDGDITFIDTYGRKYSITRLEYKYFMEDVSFSVRKKDTLVVHPRKDFELEYSFGLSASVSSFKHTFTPDDYYLGSSWNGSYAYIPLCLKLGVGKYLSRENYVGISSDIAVMTSAQSFFNVGLRFSHQYDAYKNNCALYIPIEVQFNSTKFDFEYQVADTVIDQQFGGTVYYYPSNFKTDHSIQSLGLSFGQGVSFILPKKKSISLELSVFKNFILSHKVLNLDRAAPKSEFKNAGLKLAFFYNI